MLKKLLLLGVLMACSVAGRAQTNISCATPAAITGTGRKLLLGPTNEGPLINRDPLSSASARITFTTVGGAATASIEDGNDPAATITPYTRAAAINATAGDFGFIALSAKRLYINVTAVTTSITATVCLSNQPIAKGGAGGVGPAGLTAGEAVSTNSSKQLVSEPIIYADQIVGVGNGDCGDKINVAYATLPAGGGKIIQSQPCSFSTAISFSTAGKPALLECVGNGAVLTYTGTGTMITENYGGSGTDHTWIAGIENCTFVSSVGSSGGSSAVLAGGTNGAEGLNIRHSKFSGFQNGIIYSSNTFDTDVTDTIVIDCTVCLNVPVGLTNAGAKLNFNSDEFANGSGTGFHIKIDLLTADVRFIACAFDNISIEATLGDTSFTDPRFDWNINTTSDFLQNAGGVITMQNPFLEFEPVAGTVPTQLIESTNSGSQTFITGLQASTGKTIASVLNSSAGIITRFGTPQLSGFTAESVFSLTGEIFGCDFSLNCTTGNIVRLNQASGLAANTQSQLFLCGADVTPTTRCPLITNNGNGDAFNLEDAAGNPLFNFNQLTGLLTLNSLGSQNIALVPSSGTVAITGGLSTTTAILSPSLTGATTNVASTIQSGIDAATVGSTSTLTVRGENVSAGGTNNLAGGPVIIQAGVSTGTATPATVKTQHSVLGLTSANTAQAVVTDRVVHQKALSTTSAQATSLFNIASASNTAWGLEILVHVDLISSTPNVCGTTERFSLTGTNNNGSFGTVNVVAGVISTLCSSGTLTLAITATAANPSVISITPTWGSITSITSSTATVEIENVSRQEIGLL